jgi:ASC-1-like (ASCH) protein
MKTHEAGRESSLLSDIKTGRKTVEGRLARGKFLEFKVGDTIRLREDFYRDGQLITSIPDRARTEVTKVEKYESFEEMLEDVGFEKVIPRAGSVKVALEECRKFYGVDDEAKYGVLAIHFKLLKQ